MKKYLTTLLLNLVFLFSLISTAQSDELCLSWPVEGSLGLKFGEKYQAEGKERTHLGVDILAPEGTEVRSPVEGEVSFAGQVAGRLALTFNFKGYKISLSPLQEITVSKGEKVERGKVVGKIAAEGDYSSTEPHLHLSLRDAEGKYLDPLPFLIKVELKGEPQIQTEPQPASELNVVNREASVETLKENLSLGPIPEPVFDGQNEAKLQLEKPVSQTTPQPHLSGEVSLTEKALLEERAITGKEIVFSVQEKKRFFVPTPQTQLGQVKKRTYNKERTYNSCYQQPKGLGELTKLSKKGQEKSAFHSEKEITFISSFNFAILIWSFLVIPLFYAFLSLILKKEESLSLFFSLARA